MLKKKKKQLLNHRLKGRTKKIKHPEVLLANGTQKTVIGMNKVYGM